MEEAVPVVRLGDVVPAPVRLLGVGEDDPDALVFLVRVAPDVEVALGRSGGRAAGRLEPRVLIGGVVDDELGDDADAAAVRFGDEVIEVVERAVARMDVLVVGDVVAVVSQRRRVERQQPEAVDAEALQVVELLRQAGEVADAVVGAVEERADVRLVDDGVLVPEGVGIGVIGDRALCVTVGSVGRRSGSGAGIGLSHEQDVRDADPRVEPHVVPRAAPEVPLVRQQILRPRRVACGVNPQSASGSCTKPCCMWNGSRLTTTSMRSRAVCGPLAVAEQLGVVGRVEREPPIVLQRRVLAPDLVDAAR